MSGDTDNPAKNQRGYAPCGTIETLPEPAEDPSRHHIATLRSAAVCQRGWTNDELNAATTLTDMKPGPYGFPHPYKTHLTRGTVATLAARDHEWTLRSLVEWEDRIVAMAQRIPKR